MTNLDEAKQDAMLPAREFLSDAMRFGKSKLPDAFVVYDGVGMTFHALLTSTVLAGILEVGLCNPPA